MAARTAMIRTSAGFRRQFRFFFGTGAGVGDTEAKPCVSSLMKAIRSETSPDRIAELFETHSARIPRFHAYRPVYTLTVSRLSAAGRPELVDRLLSRELSHSAAPKSEGFLLRLLSLYSSARMPDAAAAALRLAPTLGFPAPTDKSLSALLAGFRDPKRVIDSFPSLGAAPGVVSHGILLKALCEEGRLSDAEKVLDEMPSKGLQPDIVCYNALLNGYMKKGDDHAFDEVLKRISDAGLEPNVFTYNCRISYLCGKGRCGEAEELLEVMIARGLKPNTLSFNTLINGHCKEGDAASALGVFKRMRILRRVKGKKEAPLPNSETYNVLIGGLVEKGEFGSAFVVCRECLGKKLAPPFQVVKALLDGLVKNSKVEEAKAVVEKMRMALTGDAIATWSKLESTLAL